MERIYKTSYSKSKEFKEYDSQITIRLNGKYFKLINKFNKYNNSYFIRQLIRCDLREELDFEFDIKDYNKVIKTFNEQELKQLQDFKYYDKKTHKLTIKLFKEDKEEIKRRSNNITNYIELLLNDFIINVIKSTKIDLIKRDLLEVLK